jgi:hypothetical protein
MTKKEIQEIQKELKRRSTLEGGHGCRGGYLKWIHNDVGYSISALRAFQNGVYHGDVERVAQNVKDLWGAQANPGPRCPDCGADLSSIKVDWDIQKKWVFRCSKCKVWWTKEELKPEEVPPQE